MAMGLVGLVVRALRADAGVTAITPRIAGGGLDPIWPKPDPRPCVVVVGSTPGRAPWGPGSSRLGLQEQLVFVRCYGGGGTPSDERAAVRSSEQLRGAVTDALHDKGIRRFTGGKAIFLSDALSGGGPSTEPETRWPLDTGSFRIVGPAQAVA